MTDFIGRRRTSARRALLAITTALCTGLAAPAFADSPHPNLDANGVDLTDGSFNLRLPIASVGSGQAELALVAYGASWDNWTGFRASQSTYSGVTTIVISMGQRFDTFTSANGYSSSTRGTGATLTVNASSSLTYRTLEGEVVTFGTLSAGRRASSITNKAGLTTFFDYDEYANCPRVIDPEPSQCSYSYRLGGVHNEAGYAIQWAFASNTAPAGQNPGPTWYRRVSATLFNGNTGGSRTITYSYPATNVAVITTPGGKAWRITGDGQTVTGVRRPSASSDTTAVTFPSAQEMVVTRDGVATSYVRTVSGSTATMVVKDAQNNVTTIVSDMNTYRPTSITDALNRTTTMTYDTLGRPTEVAYPEGNKVQYTYDARGNVTETRLKAKPSAGVADIVTSAGYAATCTDASCNSPLWTKDANGNQTDYAYDGTTGLVTSIKAPPPSAGANRPETRITYSDVAGTKVATAISTCQTGVAPACVGTADETKQTIGYDPFLNVTTSTVAAGDNSLSATSTMTYDTAGNLLTADGPLAGNADTTTYRWSADREAVGVIAADPDGAGPLKRAATKVTYNADGQATTTEIGTMNGTMDADWAAFASAQQATATYDANARKTSDTLTAGGTAYAKTGYGYDVLGRLVCTAVRMDPAQWGAQTNNCAGQTTGPNGPDRVTQVGYDAVGRVTTTTSAFGTAQAATETVSYTPNTA